jgi:hypothetical protein
VPLAHFVKQEDQPTALVDLGVDWPIHPKNAASRPLRGTLRKPDRPPPKCHEGCPGVFPGIEPEVVEFAVGEPLPDGTPVMARLTRYRTPEHTDVPVLMIHGYSASGTTFAHPAIPCGGLAGYLARETKAGVWVLDLRSSAGMADRDS